MFKKYLFLKGSLMKKLFVLLGVIVLSTGMSFASMSESDTSNIDILRRQGFSESALHIVDTAKYHAGDKSGRYYTRNVDNGKKLGKTYTVIKDYVDPIQDDGLFGEHQINFSNSWDWGRNKYSGRYNSKEKKVENL